MKIPRRSRNLNILPQEIRIGNHTIAMRGQRIPHVKILRAIEECSGLPAGIVSIYRANVLPFQTRTIRLLGRKNSATIIYSLLGYEVVTGYKRIQCPDHVTARYIRLFSEIGCRSVKLPYDPTVTAQLIPQLESALEKIKQTVREIFPGNLRLQSYVIRHIYSIIRRDIEFS